VVKQLKEEEGILYSESVTKHETISGGDVGGSKGFATFKKQKIQEAMKLGISEEDAIRIVSRYGSNVDTILDIYQEKKEEAEKENIDQLVFAELIYGVEKEWVCKPVDF